MNHTVSRLLRLFAAALILAGGLALPPQVVHAAGATLTVDSTLDADSAFDEACTLREAIKATLNDADYHECTNSGDAYGADYIQFAIAGGTTIALSTFLPVLPNGTLTINGYNSGTPIIIDGANAHQAFTVGGSATLTLGSLTIRHAYTSGSGAAISNIGTVVVLNSTFLDNTAGADGGAISTGPGGYLTIANSTFSGNSGAYGGAILNYVGSATILNSTFAGNVATIHGGAVATWDGSETLDAVTVIHNTIMANSAAPSPEDCWKGFDDDGLTGGFNLVETTAADPSSCAAITAITSDPMLGTLTSTPAYFPLRASSPAIDAGDVTTCSSAPMYNASQNHIPRPQDGDNDGLSVCDIGSTESPVSLTFRSTGSRDGWVLESTETSGIGGSLDASATTLRLGDDTARRQYRGVLSFATSVLPDAAVLTSVKLKVKRQSVTGAIGDPLSLFSGFMTDVKKGFLGSSTSLQKADFQASATATYGPFSPALHSDWYTLNLNPARGKINKLSSGGGVTQIRLRFQVDDNNDALANYLNLYSGNDVGANRPKLMIVYYVP